MQHRPIDCCASAPRFFFQPSFRYRPFQLARNIAPIAKSRYRLPSALTSLITSRILLTRNCQFFPFSRNSGKRVSPFYPRSFETRTSPASASSRGVATTLSGRKPFSWLVWTKRAPTEQLNADVLLIFKHERRHRSNSLDTQDHVLVTLP